MNSVATQEVGQLYVITTVDEGVYQQLMPIIWSNLRIYGDHIINMGGWHAEKNYFSRLGRKVSHSGFKDIIIDANLCTGGTLNGIISCSGKLFNKTSYIYKVLLEALERLLIDKFNELKVEGEPSNSLDDEEIEKTQDITDCEIHEGELIQANTQCENNVDELTQDNTEIEIDENGLTETNREHEIGDNELTQANTDCKIDEAFFTLIFKQSQDNLEKILSNKDVMKKFDSYIRFQNDVRQGSLGLTAKFWISVMDDIKRAIYLENAMKTNNFDLFKSCLHDMSPIFFSNNGQNYARYLPIFAMTLSNIEKTHPGSEKLLRAGAISSAKTNVKSCRSPADLVVETGINCHGKSKGGLGGGGAGFSGLHTKEETYEKYVRTTHQRADQKRELLNMCNIETRDGSEHVHHATNTREILKQEADVKKVVDVLTNNFMNPFDMEDEDLYIISSGKRIPADIATDILNRDKWGVAARDAYIKERLLGEAPEEKDRNIHKKISKCKLRNFDSIHKKVKMTTTSNKVVEYKEQTNVLLQIMVKSQNLTNSIDMEKLCTYPLTAVPSVFGTPDGIFCKTNKATAFHHIIKSQEIEEVDPRNTQNALTVIDGNAVFHQLTDVPSTFETIAEKIFKVGVASRSTVIFSTDMYDENSLKSHERRRRGCTTEDDLLIQGVNMRKPKDFKAFLRSDNNKQQLCEILKKVWCGNKMAGKLVGKKVILIVNGEATLLSSNDGEHTQSKELASLYSTHDETDRRVVIYISYAEEQGYDRVIVRTPDTDIFLSYYTMLSNGENLSKSLST